jgi:hypothetical protein
MVINITTSMGVFDNLIFRLAAIFLYYKVNSKNRINEIPVIINNFNRLDSLKKQLAWLEKIEQRNIFIIDNCSDYQPLLDFYKTTPYTVFKLDENVGFLSIWKTIIFKLFKKTYYIYTDSDILPVETCPLNAIVYFYNLLQKYPNIDKVGFALKIDDLTSTHILKDLVLVWEKKYWDNEIEKNVYISPIDTTFALYRPSAKGGSELSALRTGGEYIARHLTWYIDPANLTDEDLHYINTANESSSWIKALKKLQYT